jgi:hypothetical protein
MILPKITYAMKQRLFQFICEISGLVSHGHSVAHITNASQPTAHALSKDARIVDGRLVYRGDYLL